MSHSRFFCAVVSGLLNTILLLSLTQTSCAQDYQAYLEDGEFSAAIDAADGDSKALRNIATSQLAIGEKSAAVETFSGITNDVDRTRALNMFQIQGSGSSGSFGGGFSGGVGSDRSNNGGSAGATVPNGGGITQADFTTLTQLLQNTVGSETWEANGSGNGTMFPFPTGVWVDAEGTLNRIRKSDRTFASRRNFEDTLVARAPVQQPSTLRKVSLTRLERAVQLRVAQGMEPTEAMMYLAGLTEIRFVMIDPDLGEVIIAGPAGGWKQSDNGKIISSIDEQPVMLLDDFVVCLRNAFAEKGKFGCAIVPRKENLAATQKYVSTAKGSGKKWQRGLQEALGKQDIDVFGISPGSHAARILVEADHHMKLLGMGIEPSINSVPSYLKRVELDANGNPPPMDVVRWWFALNYEQLISNEDQTLFEFRGPGVKVLAETEMINKHGDRIHTGKAVGPTKTFARDFTEHFSKLATIYPVYNELKNVFDLAIVANMIREFRLGKKAGWGSSFFVESKGNVAFKTASYKPATTVDSVINRRILKSRRNGKTTIHTLVGVSGGVSFDPDAFLNVENVETERDIEFTSQLGKATKNIPAVDRWWWD
jgi:hypothetical protein